MTCHAVHRLDGLEPDNLLAFMALLGLLRTLDEARPDWRPRVSWTVDEPPLRPRLHVAEEVAGNAIVEAAAEGMAVLVRHHDFNGLSDLRLSPDEAARMLREAAGSDRYTADLWAALVSNAAIVRDGKRVEPTPLCLMFGQGHQHFLSRLASVPREAMPPKRGSGRNKSEISETECLHEALFTPWQRPDATLSFRWDPDEDVRYALRARDPTDSKTKETTQHGANRLAAVGLSVLTVVPRYRFGKVRLVLLGGSREPDGGQTLDWPIWSEPISLAGIRALIGHPRLDHPKTRIALGVVEIRRARRISFGKFMNVTRAEARFEDSSSISDTAISAGRRPAAPQRRSLT